ncbi:hypothetical protein ACFQ9X_11710 [Catenulispora yoronensis]
MSAGIEDFVAQCAAGLPQAVTLLARTVVEAEPGRRDCVTVPTPDLEALLTGLLSGVLGPSGSLGGAITLDELVTASAEVRAPWLISTTGRSGMAGPTTTRVLEGMRGNLWGMAPAEVAPTIEPFVPAAPALHPFLAAALTGLLARRDGAGASGGAGGLPTYEDRYSRLLNATTAADKQLPPEDQHPERLAYCQLALGNVKNAARILNDQFNVNTVTTSQWIRMVCLAAQAPCPTPREIGTARAFADCVQPSDLGTVGDEERSVTRLLAALWLAGDIWTVPRPVPGGGLPGRDERLPWIPDAVLAELVRQEVGFLFGRSARGDREDLQRFGRLFEHEKPTAPAGQAGGPSASGWWRRRRRWQQAAIGTSAFALVAAGVAVPIALRTPCGEGLRYNGDAKACVGVDIDSGEFVSHDPLAPLEQWLKKDNQDLDDTVAKENASRRPEDQVYTVSLVFLQEMTPNDSTSLTFAGVRHAVEGAIAQTELANADAADHHSRIRYRLLLANFGTHADGEQDAVAEIRAAAKAQRIAAVVGIGQSSKNAKAAIRQLADGPGDHFTVVGSDITDDAIGMTDAGTAINGFYRVVGTNSQEADAVRQYLQTSKLPHSRAVLFEDTNQNDAYVTSSAWPSAS